MGQSSTGTLRTSPVRLVLSAFALLALVLSLFAFANPVRATHTTDPAIDDGTIAIFKQMCESIGDQNVCNGRDVSLNGYKVDFTVQSTTVEGETITPGPIVHTITVTLGDNAGGGGNLGAGSQGRSIAEPFDLGTYIVCEVEKAYKAGAADVPLVAVPRPEDSSGGTNQFGPFSDECIVVTLTKGAAELKFLDQRADLATKTGMKFNDLDADGVKDAGEPGLAGWVIYADLNNNSALDTDEPSATTGSDGTYTIPIAPGSYTFREVQQAGWRCTFPVTTCAHMETLTAGQISANNDFGNTVIVVTQLTPTLVIDKVANTETITISGPNNALVATPSVVTWTLSYTLTNGPVTGAVITDVVPTGFTFLDASNGGTLANGTITWNLGTLTTSGSVSFRTTVNPATISRTGPTVNTAVIDSNETPSDDGQDSVTVTVVPPPLGGNPTPAPVVRTGTLGGVPNTAMELPSNGAPVALLALVALASLGYIAHRNVAVKRTRR